MAITPPAKKSRFKSAAISLPSFAMHAICQSFASLLIKKAKFRPIFGHNSLVDNIIRDSSPFCNRRSFQKMCDSSHTFWDFVY